MIAEKILTKEEVEAFRKVFGMPPPISGLFNKLVFDVFSFDDFLHTECGYTEEEHGSMRDFLQEKYGDGVMYLVEGMINSAVDPEEWRLGK